MWIAGLLLLVILASWFLTRMFLQYALAKQLLDIPNSRSSHQLPTPSGGGIVIAVTFFIAILVLYFLGSVEKDALITCLGSGILLSTIGYWDDRRNISAILRLFLQIIAAMWVLYWVGDIPDLGLFHELQLFFPLLPYVLIVIYLIWLINLYNFMDGINGIAGIEAITVCLCGAFITWRSHGALEEWILPLVLMSAVAGFIFWNFPRARIFMGDAGSGFLGLLLGVFSIQASLLSPELFLVWLIMLGVFFVDATVTLFRRILRGEKFYEAHRIHAYQWAARKWGHTKVTITVLSINLLWLFPLAYSMTLFPEMKLRIAVLALLPLVLAALYLGAGRPERDITL